AGGELFFTGAHATGINNHGNIVGWFMELFDLPFDPEFNYSFFDSYISRNRYYFWGVNDAGHVVAQYFTDAPSETAFLIANGTLTTIIPAGRSVLPRDVNNSDVVVGSYLDAGDVGHGFVWSNSKTVTLEYPGAQGTAPEGLNDAGIVVGSYSMNNV